MAGTVPPGQVVILNGPPRSGKTSIANQIQTTLDGIWLNLGVDAMQAITPEHLSPGIGLRPGGERPDPEDLVLAPAWARPPGRHSSPPDHRRRDRW